MYRRTPEDEWLPAHWDLFNAQPADLANLTPLQLDAAHAYTEKATAPAKRPGR
jgi:hypothetical protein